MWRADLGSVARSTCVLPAEVFASTAYAVPSSGTATDTDPAELDASTVVGALANVRCTPPALDDAVTVADLRSSATTAPADE